MSQFDFYQIPTVGVDEPDLVAARTDVSIPIRRAVDEKICNFGALNVGARKSSDYTKTELTWKNKDELSDWKNITTFWQEAERNENPYVLGSTIKRVRDDQFFRMTMSNNRGLQLNQPKWDVSDTNLVDAANMTAGKNWPSEGWRSYGGKYDHTPYVGGGTVH